ncbi:hypothetical protein Ndes2526B_g00052 [Nannochloris sp. 'desiccata']|nr:hypothetical protein KSW81_002875 [Chlorella desiccata (nom. nud.)]
MMITSIAVVSPSNAPLYISIFNVPDDESLRLQALMHSSLDVLEERVAHGCRQGPNAPPDFFLGLLSISNGFKVYGAISNTKRRFLVATTDGVVREEDVKMVLAKIHTLYCDAASNPFYDPGMPLDSPQFAKEVKKVATMVQQQQPPLPQIKTAA